METENCGNISSGDIVLWGHTDVETQSYGDIQLWDYAALGT